MNSNTRNASWTFAVLGYLATLCFMQMEDVFVSRVAVAALYLVGALIPFVLITVAAKLAVRQSVAIAIMASSGSFTIGGSLLYWYYFSVVRDDYAGLLFIIVPSLQFLVAMVLYGIALWTRKTEVS